MESLFTLLQKNVLDHHPWTTREQLRIVIVIWIERTKPPMPKAALGRLTPVELEVIMNTPVAPAA